MTASRGKILAEFGEEGWWFLGVLVLLVGFYIWGAQTRCVRLPNGINIGYEAILNFSKPYFRPGVVVKYRSGDQLLPGDAFPFFATETTVYGTAAERGGSESRRFAWREDVGLVFRYNQPGLYMRLVSDAGPKLDGVKAGNLGVGIYYLDLKKIPDYDGQWCRTRWIRW